MHVTRSNFFRRILRSEALDYKSYFFSEQPFYGNYSTLDPHTNIVISHAFAYSSRWRRKPWQGLWINRNHFLISGEDVIWSVLMRRNWTPSKISQIVFVECFHSRGQHLFKFIRTKESICITEKRVQLPRDWFGTPTWPPFRCFGTPIWPPWRHVKTIEWIL